MSVIGNVNPEFLLTYINFGHKKKMSPEELFKRLSFEMGGDGKTITKKQLDDYIAKADSKKIKISKERLKALKQLQKNWDTISKGRDYITYENLANYGTLLASAAIDRMEIDDESTDDSSDSDDLQAKNNPLSKINKDMLKSLGLINMDDAKKADLHSYLQTLLAKDSNDDEIGNAIDSIINLIAKQSNPSSVEVEA